MEVEKWRADAWLQVFKGGRGAAKSREMALVTNGNMRDLWEWECAVLGEKHTKVNDITEAAGLFLWLSF